MIPVAVVLQIIDLAMLATRIPGLIHEIRKARADIDAMTRQGRNPTPEEWRALSARLDIYRRRLRTEPPDAGQTGDHE